jgi:hypothetical protein
VLLDEKKRGRYTKLNESFGDSSEETEIFEEDNKEIQNFD